MRPAVFHGLVLVVLIASGSVTRTAFAGSHLWRFNEVFSNEDGTIQFVELKECCGSDIEILLDGKWVSSDATGEIYHFEDNLVGPTSNRYLLMATAGFAALPGAPTPDYVLPNGFLSVDGDTLRYWTYPAATMTWSAGDLPTDGQTSLNIDGTTSANSPTNYAGESGSVLVEVVPAVSAWGLVVTLLLFATVWTVLASHGRAQRSSVPEVA
jgi:hypothetical protein